MIRLVIFLCLKVDMLIPLAPRRGEQSLLVGSKVLFLPTEKVFTTRGTVFTLIFQLLCADGPQPIFIIYKGEIMNVIRAFKTSFCLIGCSLFFLLCFQATSFAQGSPPLLQVDVTELDFGETDTSKTFVITNGGEGTLEWLLSEEEDWLSTDVTSGMLEAGLSETVTVEVDRSQAVSAGLFTSLITVTSLDMSESIEVSILVPEEPVLMVSPVSLEFGPEDVIKELSIANSGWSVLEWSVVAGEVWVEPGSRCWIN